MKASLTWLATSGAEFSAGEGRSGCAHLTHYTVEYKEWGDGPPLVLVPGLAGGFELLGPLARLLADSPAGHAGIYPGGLCVTGVHRFIVGSAKPATS